MFFSQYRMHRKKQTDNSADHDSEHDRADDDSPVSNRAPQLDLHGLVHVLNYLNGLFGGRVLVGKVGSIGHAPILSGFR